MRNFKKLIIWQKGMEIAKALGLATKKFPFSEKSEMLSHHATRSAISIPAAIAEGNAKKNGKESRRYIGMSLSRVFELETHLSIIRRQDEFPSELLREILEMVKDEQKMLESFINKL